MSKNFFCFTFLLTVGAFAHHGATTKSKIMYDKSIIPAKVIVRNIIIKGCSKIEQTQIQSALKFSPGEIINLQSSTISTNIKAILERCSFVQDVDCRFIKINDRLIDVVFTVVHSALIIDINFDNLEDDDLKKSLDKDCYVKCCNDDYINTLKQKIISLCKKKDIKDYKIFVSDHVHETQHVPSFIIKTTNIFHGKTLTEILDYLCNINDNNLRKMFKKKYKNIKTILGEFIKLKQEYFSNNNTVIPDYIIKSKFQDKEILQSIQKNRWFVKITLSQVTPECLEQKICNISIAGNNRITIKEILKNININKKTCFQAIVNIIKNFTPQTFFTMLADIFNKYFLHTKESNSVNDYRDKIIELYRQNGFVNAQITQIDIITDKKSNNLHVTYHIDEGQKFFVNSIKIKGNKTFQKHFLLSLINISPGDVFSVNKIYDAINGTAKNMMMDGIKTLYNNQGFLNCDIKINTKYIDNKVDIIIQINENEKSKIGIVRFYGNKYTDENYFKSYIDLYPSEDFVVNKLIISQQGLSQSEFVNKEKILINPKKNNYFSNTQDIDCIIEERFTPKLNAMCNLDPDDGGLGIKGSFVAGFDNCNFHKLFHLKDHNVKWLGKRHSVNFNMSATPKMANVIDLKNNNYGLSKQKYNMSLAVGIPEIFRIWESDVGLSTNFSWTQNFCYFDDDDDDYYENINNDDTKEIVRNINIGTHFMWMNFNRTKTIYLGFLNLNYKWNIKNSDKKQNLDVPIVSRFRWNNIDKSFFVTRGIDFNVSLSLTNPILLLMTKDWIRKGIKGVLYLGSYFELFKNVVFNLSGYLGGCQSFSEQDDYFKLGTGILETYTDGMRSTEFFLKCIDDRNINLKFINKSRCRLAYKINAELRLKLIDHPYFGCYIFGFFNGGNLYLPSKDNLPLKNELINYPIIYSSSGVGVRLNIPMLGTIGLHFGIDTNTNKPNFNITIRQSFETIS